MFGFLIKKNFCDGWDNLITMVLINAVTLAVGAGLFGIWQLLATRTAIGESEMASMLLTYGGIVVIFLLYSITAMAFGELAVTIANFGGIHFLDFFRKIPSVLKDGVLFGLLCSVLTIISEVGIHWYFTQGSYLYLFMGCLFIWFDFFAIITLQWFIPVRAIMHNPFKKCLKKSLILMLDNTGFSIAMALYDLVLVIFSIFFVGLIPSIAGVTLARVNALRLRLYKYDYLELHPELKTKRERKQIPWEELIYEDRETLGPRKFKTFLFPWKE